MVKAFCIMKMATKSTKAILKMAYQMVKVFCIMKMASKRGKAIMKITNL